MQKCQRLAGEATQGPAASSRLAVLRWGGGYNLCAHLPGLCAGDQLRNSWCDPQRQMVHTWSHAHRRARLGLEAPAG